MTKKKFNILQFLKRSSLYIIFILIAFFLSDKVYGNIGKDTFFNLLKKVDFTWVLVSVLIALISHWVRSLRWVISIKPLGASTTTFHAYIALLSGYFVNIFLPRVGEVARCTVLNRLSGVPVQKAFGTVVTERVIDTICLFLVSAMVIFLEADKLFPLVQNSITYLSTFFGELINNFSFTSIYTLLFILIIVAFFVLLYFLYAKRKVTTQKLRSILLGFKEGVFTLMTLEKREVFRYLLYTALIWVFYFAMTFVLFYSYPDAENLPKIAALSVMIMGGLGVAIPTPGGIGSFHFFVAATLSAYSLNQENAAVFALIMHASHVVSIAFFGGLAFVYGFIKTTFFPTST